MAGPRSRWSYEVLTTLSRPCRFSPQLTLKTSKSRADFDLSFHTRENLPVSSSEFLEIVDREGINSKRSISLDMCPPTVRRTESVVTQRSPLIMDMFSSGLAANLSAVKNLSWHLNCPYFKRLFAVAFW